MRKSRAPEYYRERIRKALARNRWGMKAGYGRVILTENRGLRTYNNIFRAGTGCNIVDSLEGLKRKKLVIVDDGAGRKGRFLVELKKALLERGIKSRTIAVSLRKRKGIERNREKGLIDEAAYGPAEEYVPREPVDAIFSVLGSVQYVQNLVKKDHLLKYAHSLRKGGIMMLGFYVNRAGTHRPEEVELRRGLSKSTEGREGNFLQEYMARVMDGDMKDDFEGVKRAFEKRGFEARFEPVPFNTIRFYPNWVLVLKKLK